MIENSHSLDLSTNDDTGSETQVIFSINIKDAIKEIYSNSYPITDRYIRLCMNMLNIYLFRFN